jgi:DNA/RNA-binding domain of Phe-tRNA-synthetase-like protein
MLVMFEVSDAWKVAFPHAHVGVLVMRDVVNPAHHADLEREKELLESQLRERFAGQTRGDLDQLPVLQAYAAYYKRFKKTYHVQLQLESIVFKGKSIPSVAALVEAMFMAEVKNLLLTAGHDLDALQLPARVEVSQGNESYIVLRGQPQPLKPGDMFIADRAGIISNILYGPDQRTQIQSGTHNVMFTVYAPDGIHVQAVQDHLRDIERYVRLIAPESRTELLHLFGAD